MTGDNTPRVGTQGYRRLNMLTPLQCQHLRPGQSGKTDPADDTQGYHDIAQTRAKHPGQRNTLDALCQRYAVDNSQRELHGALLDAEILADVYLVMTGGQTNLLLSGDDTETEASAGDSGGIRRLAADRPRLKIVRASADELALHESRLAEIDKASGGNNLWRREAGE